MELKEYSILAHELIHEVLNFNSCCYLWSTPNTYDRNYKFPPDTSGVYLLFAYENFADIGVNGEIVYIGSSKNLAQRKARHEVLRMISQHYKYIQFYFREIESDYKDIEKALIQTIKPKYNTQHING
jgi:excinuclease UvrABC nuclease subunit